MDSFVSSCCTCKVKRILFSSSSSFISSLISLLEQKVIITLAQQKTLQIAVISEAVMQGWESEYINKAILVLTLHLIKLVPQVSQLCPQLFQVR